MKQNVNFIGFEASSVFLDEFVSFLVCGFHFSSGIQYIWI